MELGLCAFATERGIGPDALAVEAEQRGFRSLWFTDHSHIPLSRATPWPGGSELPRHYYELFDPLVAMTAAAVATTTLRVGSGVALVVQRDPIQLAKEIATLDVISGGRVDVGVGGGWNLEEMANHGTDPATRWRLLRERVEAMTAIWTQEAAEYHGELVDFDPIAAFPKPVQEPRPPIHVGGGYPQGMRRAIRYGDGWMPLYGRGDVDLVTAAAELRREAEAAGRDASRMQVTLFGVPPGAIEPRRLAGSAVTRILFGIVPAARDETLRELDRLAREIDRL